MKYSRLVARWFLSGYAVVALVGCASFFEAPPPAASSDNQRSPATLRQAVVKSALQLLGQKPDARVTVNGRRFMLDCIGTVSAAWWGAGYDIQKDFNRYPGNGVNRLYQSCKNWDALTLITLPLPGDIVFWENTYDRNEDGVRYNDGLTHAGIVISIDPDGTVKYLHESVTRGVSLAWFNLKHPQEAFSPDGKVWNSPMYLGSSSRKSNNPPHWLSGDLWKAFGAAEPVGENTK